MSTEKHVDKLIAAILGLLLGGFGIHKFYMGNTRAGIIYLCLFWTGIPEALGIVEGVVYLITDEHEFQKRYVYTEKTFLDIF